MLFFRMLRKTVGNVGDTVRTVRKKNITCLHFQGAGR